MSEVVSLKAALAAANVTELALLQDVKPGLWLPDPLPAWSQNCMPCPVNYYSPGGQQGFAQCRPCPGSFTTAGATAAANCLCECNTGRAGAGLSWHVVLLHWSFWCRLGIRSQSHQWNNMAQLRITARAKAVAAAAIVVLLC
jgi:hypothetical protein